MKKIHWMLSKTMECADHPLYHPEKTVYNHILLVMVRALIYSGDVNVVLTALLHDLCKPMSGAIIDTVAGKYWSNQDHAQQAHDLIRNDDDIRYMIKQTGGDEDTVAQMCKYHMACKESIIRKAKHLEHMELFVALDDMMHRKEVKPVRGDIKLPDGHTYMNKQIWFVGQSRIQQTAQNGQFTITVSNCPYTYPIADIPQMFFSQGQFKFF